MLGSHVSVQTTQIVPSAKGWIQARTSHKRLVFCQFKQKTDNNPPFFLHKSKAAAVAAVSPDWETKIYRLLELNFNFYKDSQTSLLASFDCNANYFQHNYSL